MRNVVPLPPGIVIRKPRTKPVRVLRVLEQPGPDTDGWAAIEIAEGKKVDRYLLRVIPTDFDGALAFELEKLDAELNTAAVYHTLLDGPRSSCDCPGGTYCGHCRHREGIEAIRRANRIPAFSLPVLSYRSAGDLAANDPAAFDACMAAHDYPDEAPSIDDYLVDDDGPDDAA